MIDSLEAGSASARLEAKAASVKLQNIFFAADLALPLYPTLFNYGAIPTGLNLVPSFQVRDSAITRVEMTLELRQDESFEFQSDPTVRVIHGNLKNVHLSFLSAKKCILEIDLDPKPSLVVLQVRCRKTSQEPSHREQIEGGLFLSIVNDPGQVVPPTQSHIAVSSAGSVQLTRVDAQGRLHYNIFQDTVYIEGSPVVSAGLEPEPAFRVRQGESLNAMFSLGFTDLVFVPRTACSLEIALEMVEPVTRPSNLHVGFPETAEGDPVPGGCAIHWATANDPVRLNYRLASFSMEIHELTREAKVFLQKHWNWNRKFDLRLLELIAMLIEDAEFLRKFPLIGTADPTIIDTPRCTMINDQMVCMETL